MRAPRPRSISYEASACLASAEPAAWTRFRLRSGGGRDATSHPAGFLTLRAAPRPKLANPTAPSCLIGAPGSLAPLERTIEGRRIAAGRPHQSFAYRVNNLSRWLANDCRSLLLNAGGPPVCIPLARNVSMKSRMLSRWPMVSVE